MATPDMTHASGAQDQTEARKSGVRGWFQPPAADAGGSETDSGAVPDRIGEPGEAAGQKSGAEVGDAEDETGDARDETSDADGAVRDARDQTADDQDEAPSSGDDLAERDGPPAGDIGGQGTAEAPDTQVGVPEETVVFPRLRAGETMAAAGEPVAPAQASGAISAERSGDDEPPTAIRGPLAGTGAPKVPPDNRPPDITRPQLILDDTVVDMAGLRGGWSSRQTADGSGAGAADPAGADGTSPADGAAAPADAGDPPSGKAAKRNRSVFGPEPASRPDMLTNADTVVMASLKGQKGSLDGSSARAEEAANARNAAAVK